MLFAPFTSVGLVYIYDFDDVRLRINICHVDTDLVNTKYKNETKADTAQRTLIHTFELTPMSVVVEGALQLMADATKNSKSSTRREHYRVQLTPQILAEAVLCLPEGNIPMDRPALPGI